MQIPRVAYNHAFLPPPHLNIIRRITGTINATASVIACKRTRTRETREVYGREEFFFFPHPAGEIPFSRFRRRFLITRPINDAARHGGIVRRGTSSFSSIQNDFHFGGWGRALVTRAFNINHTEESQLAGGESSSH